MLNYLPILNDKLTTLYFNNNIVFSILYGDCNVKGFDKINLMNRPHNISKIIINGKLNILNTFRFTFYCLKFKKHFKKWLWERVREPKIIAKFHPDYLNNLNESDDLETFIKDWIDKK